MISSDGVALAGTLALPMPSRQSDEHFNTRHDVEQHGIQFVVMSLFCRL